MTVAEKIEMYKGKKAFVDDISKAFEARSYKTGILSIEYEVYKKIDDNHDHYVEYLVVEYLVVTFNGGAKSVRCANGNSHIANYIEIGKLLNGGYYDEVPAYEALTEEGFFKINLEEN